MLFIHSFMCFMMRIRHQKEGETMAYTVKELIAELLEQELTNDVVIKISNDYDNNEASNFTLENNPYGEVEVAVDYQGYSLIDSSEYEGLKENVNDLTYERDELKQANEDYENRIVELEEQISNMEG